MINNNYFCALFFLKDNNYITHKMRGIVFIQVVVFLLMSMTGYGQQKNSIYIL